MGKFGEQKDLERDVLAALHSPYVNEDELLEELESKVEIPIFLSCADY